MPTPPAARFLRCLTSLALCCALANGFLRGAASKDLDSIYAPFQVSQAALAPDGRHVAFAVKKGRALELQIYETERAFQKTTCLLDRNDNAVARLLRWISPAQLVVVTSAFNVLVIDAKTGVAHRVTIDALMREADPNDLKSKFVDLRFQSVPDDAAGLLVESLSPTPSDPGPPPTGIPGRPMRLELHRLNVLTGETTRLLYYDVEKETPPAATLVDRTGQPRIVYRSGAEPPHFSYRDGTAADSARGLLSSFFGGDGGWHDLDGVFRDRANFSFSLEPKNILSKRTIPLGFDTDPNVLFFASNLHRDTYGLYACDLRTGKRTDFALEEPTADLVDPDLPWTQSPLIFDPRRGQLVGLSLHTFIPKVRWLDPELAATQQALEKKFPARRVQLLNWNDERTRCLALVDLPGDAGRYFVFDRTDGRCVEYLHRARTGPGHESHPTTAFVFDSPTGGKITGYLTLPREPGKVPPPLVVSLHDGPWQHLDSDYDPDAQALAAQGFACVKINYRGSTGFGLAHREAIRISLDRAPIDDVLATLEWLRGRHRIDLRRVGLVGEGYGGYLALRALQLQPGRFLSAVTINGLTRPNDLWSGTEIESFETFAARADQLAEGLPKAEFRPPGKRFSPDPRRALAHWLVSEQPGLSAIAVTADLRLLTQPVLIVHDPENVAAPVQRMTALRSNLDRQGRAPETMRISEAFARGDPAERQRVYRRIGEFFNLTLNEYKVKVGEAEEKK